MANPPLYHQTARDGRGGIPAWWFGAPAIAFAYTFMTPALLPDVVPVPAELPNGMASPLRWFVGLLLGVAALSTWQLLRWVAKR